MKTVKAWAIKHKDDGIHPSGIFATRKLALADKLIGNAETVVRVEIREIRPRRKSRGGK